MFRYFDKLFARISRWYASFQGEETPALTSMLVISLFQAFNVMAIIFLVGGVLYGRNWVITKLDIIVLLVVMLIFDYIRIYRIIGFQTMLERYHSKESRTVKLHPAIYFCASCLLLGLLRLIGFFPQMQWVRRCIRFAGADREGQEASAEDKVQYVIRGGQWIKPSSAY